MRIQILSDLHSEFEEFNPPNTNADVIVLAGDINIGSKGLEWTMDRFPATQVIYVLGNHEYYRNAIPKLTQKLKSLAKGSNVHILENDHIVIDRVSFLGCTLWTDFELFGDPRIAGYEAANVMMDYKKIRVNPEYRKLRSRDTASFHYKSRKWLRQTLEENDLEQRIIITHHAPSGRSMPEKYREDLISAAYVSDLEDLVRSSQASLWIHGHLHNSSDYMIANTRVLCNPKGYPDELNEEFVADLVVEI